MDQLNWATSKTVGNVTEIAVLAPIRQGCVPGERRTYEDSLRFAIKVLQDRQDHGQRVGLEVVPGIHFGRMIILRPEQYLVYTDLKDPKVEYFKAASNGAPTAEKDAVATNVPLPMDDFGEVTPDKSREQARPDDLRSWLLTLVEFDGDLRVYMRDIARFIGTNFDAIFDNCEDYPGSQDFELFWQWIRRYQIRTDLFYAPYSHLTVARIRQLEAFKRRFDVFVAQVRPMTGARVASIDNLFDQFLRENLQHADGFPSKTGEFRTAQGDGG